MKWFHRRRLIRLADKLEGKGPYTDAGPVPEHKFDMLFLFTQMRNGHSIKRQDFNPRQCETAACAIGWGETDPWFVSKGLRDALWTNFFGISNTYAGELFNASYYRRHGGRHVHPSVVAARLRQAAKDG